MKTLDELQALVDGYKRGSVRFDYLSDVLRELIADAERESMPEVDLADDDALRFACRVLSHGSHPPEEDRKAAKDMLMAIRERLRRPHIDAAHKG